MTKLLYIPTGDFITFSTGMHIKERTVIYEQSDYYDALENVVSDLCLSGRYGLRRENSCLYGSHTLYEEEFEILLD